MFSKKYKVCKKMEDGGGFELVEDKMGIIYANSALRGCYDGAV